MNRGVTETQHEDTQQQGIVRNDAHRRSDPSGGTCYHSANVSNESSNSESDLQNHSFQNLINTLTAFATKQKQIRPNN